MIVIGYQGIGKSTVARGDFQYVDLESTNFFVDGKRSDDWYLPYCNIAESLSRQGYIVFTSSHEVVRNRLKESSEQVVCCVPALELKDEWIAKLQKRYDESGLEKDKRALLNAKDRYEENIREIAESGFEVIWLKSINYNLKLQLLLKMI